LIALAAINHTVEQHDTTHADRGMIPGVVGSLKEQVRGHNYAFFDQRQHANMKKKKKRRRRRMSSTIPLSATGEVADFRDADQFQPGRSEFECGSFAVATCKAMAQIGKPPAQSAAQMIAEAEAWYAQYDGTDSSTNTDGMTTEQLYALLLQVGLHFQATATDMATVLAWVAVGYPVIIAIMEASVHDLALGGSSPYPWNPAGSHVIVATGLAAGGNVLVRDTANCTNLHDPNSLRPGPRTYDAEKLQLVSATVIVPPWLPRPASDAPPSTPPKPLEEGNMPLTIEQAADHFEAIDDQHWRRKDKPDIVLAYAFLTYYQSVGTQAFALFGLPTANEVETPDASGKPIPGTQMQRCERAVLCYDPEHKVDHPPYAGPVYCLHIDNDGPGADPRVAQMETQLLAVQKAALASTGALAAQCEQAVRQIKQLIDPIAV
jgi:hypothetical protein